MPLPVPIAPGSTAKLFFLSVCADTKQTLSYKVLSFFPTTVYVRMRENIWKKPRSLEVRTLWIIHLAAPILREIKNSTSDGLKAKLSYESEVLFSTLWVYTAPFRVATCFLLPNEDKASLGPLKVQIGFSGAVAVSQSSISGPVSLLMAP